MLVLALLTAAAAAATTPPCVEVDVSGTRRTDFECLNAQLKTTADAAHRSPEIKGLDAASGDTRLGIYNEAAKRQQMGRNFGKSVAPYRPPPPVYPQGLPRK